MEPTRPWLMGVESIRAGISGLKARAGTWVSCFLPANNNKGGRRDARALQGLIAMEQPQPCSCSCAGGSLSTLSAGPTRLRQQPWCCRDRAIPPPEPHFSWTQVGSLCCDSSPGPSTPLTLHSQTVQPSQHRYSPLLGALVTQVSEPQDRGATQHMVPTATILLPHPPHPRLCPHLGRRKFWLEDDSCKWDLQVLAEVPAVLVASAPGPSQQRSAAPGAAAAWPRWLVSQHFLVRG